jgi:hypothetical protein
MPDDGGRFPKVPESDAGGNAAAACGAGLRLRSALQVVVDKVIPVPTFSSACTGAKIDDTIQGED